MTQIVSGLPVSAEPGGSAAAKAPALNGDAWLKELERARWEARPRYRAGDGAAAAPGAQQHASPESGSPAGRAAAREGEAAPARPNANARDVQAPPAMQTQATVDTAAFVARATGPLLAAWTPSVVAPERMQQELLRALRSQARTRSGEPWSERNVHVQPEGEAWAVWIRDADITPERVADMLDALTRLAGETGQRRRIRLTVNGQPFVAASNHTPLAGDRLGN